MWGDSCLTLIPALAPDPSVPGIPGSPAQMAHAWDDHLAGMCVPSCEGWPRGSLKGHVEAGRGGWGPPEHAGGSLWCGVYGVYLPPRTGVAGRRERPFLVTSVSKTNRLPAGATACGGGARSRHVVRVSSRDSAFRPNPKDAQ